MANWLDKALGRKSSTTSVAVVPFDVRCECGARLTGVRTERAKRAICPQCGEAHFILPVNQYPESERKYFATQTAVPDINESPRQTTPARETHPADVYAIDADDPVPPDGDVDPDIAFDLDRNDDAKPRTPVDAVDDGEDDSDDLLDFLDEPLESERRRTQPRRNSGDGLSEAESPAQAKQTKTRRPAKTEARKSRSADTPTGMIELTPETTEWSDTRRRIVFVTVGIVVLAVGMAWYAIRNQAVDHAEIRLTAARDDGLTALENGHFAEARRQLQIALDALDIIGADEDEATSVRRMWLEADAATRLLDGSLIDVVEATRDGDSLSAEEWQKQFDARFGGRWILLDVSPIETVRCTVRSDAGEEETAETGLLYPWIVDDKPIHVAGIEKLLGAGRTRVLLAGRLAGSEFDDESQSWLVRLDPQESFLWTRFSMLVQLGFAAEDDEALRQFVRDQRAAEGDSAGVAETPSISTETPVENQETET